MATITVYIIGIAVALFMIAVIIVICCCCCDKGNKGKPVSNKAGKSRFAVLEGVQNAYSRFDDTNKKFGSTPQTGDTSTVTFWNEAVTYNKHKQVCENCSKSFGSVSALKNHERDSRCRLKKYAQLKLSDNTNNEIKVLCDKASLYPDMYRQCKDGVIDVLKKLLKHHSNRGRFSKQLDREGSTKTGLKTRKAVEFDFSVKIILLDIPTFLLGSESESDHKDWCFGTDANEEKIPPGYAKILLGPRDILRFGDCCSQGVLSPTKLRVNFQNFISDASKAIDTNGVEIVVCRELNGPAVRLILKLRSHGIPQHIDIDLTPKVFLPYNYSPKRIAQGFEWPRDNTYRFLTGDDIQRVKKQVLYLVPKKEKYWFLSFANYENGVLQLFSNNSTEKRILRCMKVRLEAWKTQLPAELKPVSSYILKEAFFWLREELPEVFLWTEDKCAERYYNLVQEIRFCFVRRQLSDYFVPTTNQMDGKEKSRSAMIQCLDEELKNMC